MKTHKNRELELISAKNLIFFLTDHYRTRSVFFLLPSPVDLREAESAVNRFFRLQRSISPTDPT